jgi:hypothetical protein
MENVSAGRAEDKTGIPLLVLSAMTGAAHAQLFGQRPRDALVT